MSEQNRILIVNFSTFFTREIFMYSLGDIKFKKPIALKKVAYSTAFLIMWILPMYYIFGLHLSVIWVALYLAPPLVLAHFASRPVWGGRGLFDFLKVLFRYITTNKIWTDIHAFSSGDTYYVESPIWISRRRELQYLADLQEKRVGKK